MRALIILATAFVSSAHAFATSDMLCTGPTGNVAFDQDHRALVLWKGGDRHIFLIERSTKTAFKLFDWSGQPLCRTSTSPCESSDTMTVENSRVTLTSGSPLWLNLTVVCPDSI